MLKVQFRESSRNANTFRMERLKDGYVVKFFVGYGDNNTSDIVVFDDNNDVSGFPYGIHFVVRTAIKTGAITITPKVSKNFIRDFGRVGEDALVRLFLSRLLAQMSYT